ncbi:beta-galactosidase-like [Acanthaster planci]|uniref:Beta-galactosidase n=1 Tax=Acanthaster planci TaxID=133434 RepID=A0A8B7XGK8_ACAPL|nr:beta-galactosidase-like [Acanthaster planci]
MGRTNLIVSLSVLSFVFLNFKGMSATRSFTIDYDHNTFVKDGQPFRYISGSLHYARVHHLYWKDRLAKMYMAGLDAVQTYVPWNLHEPKHSTYNFEGTADLETFLRMAQEAGLLVILRAGPYICGEWDMGGLPSWLLKNPNIRLRTSDPEYLMYVDSWMGVLLPKVKPFLYANGGPIITVQIENEYGSYPACDHKYIRHLLKLFKSHLGEDVVYFSTDGPSKGMLECGTLQGIYTTVDFGPGGNASRYFEVQQLFEPQGPLVNSEYYTGWLDHWGQRHQSKAPTEIVNYLDDILQLGANVNMYMFEGGTNFAFWNGANGNELAYSPQPTSYDYDAPLTEAGDPNEKYLAIRTLIGKYKKLPPGNIPPATPKYAYGKTEMSRIATLYEALSTISPSDPISSDYPISMEDIQQDFGFVLYRTQLQANYTLPTALTITGIRDRGYVLVDKNPIGILKRNTQVTLNMTGYINSTLDILVENMGRLNYGCCINDSKGIISNVTLGGVVLKSWQIYSLDLSKAQPSSLKLVPETRPTSLEDLPSGPLQIPSFFIGTLPSGPAGGPQDTFLKLTGWSKGQAFINGFNLGRYWPAEGPQMTLYVPAVVLNATTNTLILFETEHSPCKASNPFSVCVVEFVDKPILNSTIPPVEETEEVDGSLDLGVLEEYEWENMAVLASSSAERDTDYQEYEVDRMDEPLYVVDGIPDPVERPDSSAAAAPDVEDNAKSDGKEDSCWLDVVKTAARFVAEVLCFFTSIPVLVWGYL